MAKKIRLNQLELNGTSAQFLKADGSVDGNSYWHSGNFNPSNYQPVGNYATTYYQSTRNFPNGTLISTNIDYSQTQGDAWLLEIKGNMYGDGVYGKIPLDCKVQGYMYNNTMINVSGYSTNSDLSYIKAMNVNGKLCFWFPYIAYWQGFDVFCSKVMGGGSINEVVSVTNQIEPATATKKVTIPISKIWHSDSFNPALYIKKNVVFDTSASGTLVLSDDYIGGESGLIDTEYEFIIAGRFNGYYKFASNYYGYDGINYNISTKEIGIGRETSGNGDKLQVAGNISVGEDVEQLILNPIATYEIDLSNFRNAFIYLVAKSSVTLPSNPIDGQRIEIFNIHSDKIGVFFNNNQITNIISMEKATFIAYGAKYLVTYDGGFDILS